MRKATRRGRRRLAVGVLGFVALMGLAPIPLGLGPFGSYLFRYERVSLTFINMTGQDVTLQIGSAREQTFLTGYSHTTQLRAGDIELTALLPDGAVLDHQTFFSDNQDIYFNMAGSDCLAVIDAAGLYRARAEGSAEPPSTADRQRGDPNVELVARIRQSDPTYLLPPGSVLVEPGGIIPDTIPGGRRVLWIDTVSCLLLEPENEALLIAQQMSRMQDRRDRQRARREAAETAAGVEAP